MKITLDVKLNGKPQKGDILVFDGEVWCQQTKISFLNDTSTAFLQLTKEFEEIKENCDKRIADYEERIKVLEEEIKYLKGE